MLQSTSALDTLYYGTAVALVALALTAFNYVSEKEKEAEIERHPEELETRAKDLKKRVFADAKGFEAVFAERVAMVRP